MTAFVALLRAVNVGGTGKLPMSDLKAICEACGFTNVRTYIASGNAVFESDATEAAVKAALERRLADHAGKAAHVFVRTAAQMAAVLAANPFARAPGNRVTAIFLDAPPPPDALDRAVGRTDEQLGLGLREIYVWYGQGMGRNRRNRPEKPGHDIFTPLMSRQISASISCPGFPVFPRFHPIRRRKETTIVS